MADHEGHVAFDIRGRICDGQHRFLGLLIHGAPVRFGVQFGEAVEARETYDAGTARSAADILHMHGATDVSIRQAVIKSAIGYMQKLDKDVPAVPMDRAQTVEQAELHAQTLATAIGLARRSLEKPEDMPASFESCLNLNTAGTVGFLMLSGGWGSGEVGSFLSALQLGIGEASCHAWPWSGGPSARSRHRSQWGCSAPAAPPSAGALVVA